MCRIDDSESDTVSHAETRRARVWHLCDECRRVIEKGETYRHAAGLFDRVWYRHRVCAHCMVGTEWLSANCGGYVLGEVRAELREHIEEYPEIGRPLARVVVGMRRKWKALRGDGLMPVPQVPPPIELAETVR